MASLGREIEYFVAGSFARWPNEMNPPHWADDPVTDNC